MWKLSQQITFDANARDVCKFIVGPVAKRPRGVRLSNGQFAFACVLSVTNSSLALFSIPLIVHVCDDKEVDYSRHGAVWLVWNQEVAETSLTQERAGECRVGVPPSIR